MVNLTAVLALIAGAGGITLTQVGNLIPARKDFMSHLRLRKATCLEHISASHCFLLKQFQSVGIQDFDDVMRGDGRLSRDYFYETTKSFVENYWEYQKLNRAETYFRCAHFALLLSTVLLIILGVIAAVLEGPPTPTINYCAIGFFAAELIAIFVLYALGDSNEG